MKELSNRREANSPCDGDSAPAGRWQREQSYCFSPPADDKSVLAPLIVEEEI